MQWPPRTDAELFGASTHVHYEWDMFRSVVAELGVLPPNALLQTNALLESFVIHLRNMIDFLWPAEGAHDDDVIAAHFFDEPLYWNGIRPDISDTLSAARSRANKEIAHLTYSRLSVAPDAKPWRPGEMYAELKPAMEKFLRPSLRTGSTSTGSVGPNVRMQRSVLDKVQVEATAAGR